MLSLLLWIYVAPRSWVLCPRLNYLTYNVFLIWITVFSWFFLALWSLWQQKGQSVASSKWLTMSTAGSFFGEHAHCWPRWINQVEYCWLRSRLKIGMRTKNHVLNWPKDWNLKVDNWKEISFKGKVGLMHLWLRILAKKQHLGLSGNASHLSMNHKTVDCI